MAEVDPGFDSRLVRPDIGAVQVEDFADLHGGIGPNVGLAPFIRRNAGTPVLGVDAAWLAESRFAANPRALCLQRQPAR
jgi:hypothetical protein